MKEEIGVEMAPIRRKPLLDLIVNNLGADKEWDQEKLNRAKIAIVGCGTISDYVLAYLSGLTAGVQESGGSISIISDAKYSSTDSLDFLNRLNATPEGYSTALGLKEQLSRMNEHIAWHAYVQPEAESARSAMSQADIIIDLTNSRSSKESSFKEYLDAQGQEGAKSKMYISASASFELASVVTRKTVGQPPKEGGSESGLDLLLLDADTFDFKETPNSPFSPLSDLLESDLPEADVPASRPYSFHFEDTNSDAALLMTAAKADKKKEKEKSFQEADRDILMGEYDGLIQGPITGAMIATIIVDEIRKFLMPLNIIYAKDKDDPADYAIDINTGDKIVDRVDNSQDVPIQQRLNFDLLTSSFAFGKLNDGQYKQTCKQEAIQEFLGEDVYAHYQPLKGEKILLAGAGGVSTYAGLALSQAGAARADIYDFDTIEEKNRNRQVLYYEKIGNKKSAVLEERLKCVNPELLIKSYDAKIGNEDETSISDLGKNAKDYTVIISGLDNRYSRSFLYKLARELSVPVFTGTVDTKTATIEQYLPDVNTVGYESADKPDEMAALLHSWQVSRGDPTAVSCAQTIVANIVTMNAFAGIGCISRYIALKKGNLDTTKLNLRYSSGLSDEKKFLNESNPDLERPTSFEECCERLEGL